MSRYSSKQACVSMPIAQLYERLSHLGHMQAQLDKLPQDQLARIGEVRFDDNYVSINAPQVGEIRFEIVERTEPTRVVFAAANMPVPLKLSVELAEMSQSETGVTSSIDVEIPAMLRPLVGGKMQEAADRFTDLIKQLNA